MNTPAIRFLTTLWFCGVAVRLWAVETDLDAKEVFDRHILPIFKSPNPSSCTECHLAGVDLKNYVLKVHVDVKERLKSDWNSALGDTEFVEETVIESKWPRGYGKMTVVPISQLNRLVSQ